jgi:hypothetical protein
MGASCSVADGSDGVRENVVDEGSAWQILSNGAMVCLKIANGASLSPVDSTLGQQLLSVDMSKIHGDVWLPSGMFGSDELHSWRPHVRCPHLADVVWPRGLLEIGNDCFMGSALTTVDLRSTKVRLLSNRAFASCRSLRRFYGPGSLLRIGRECFLDSDLEYLEIAAWGVSRLEVGPRAFSGCTGLKYLIILPRAIRLESWCKSESGYQPAGCGCGGLAWDDKTLLWLPPLEFVELGGPVHIGSAHEIRPGLGPM